MRVFCSDCGRTLPSDDVNVATDVALCRACGALSKLSELLARNAVAPVPEGAAPRGTWIVEEGARLRVGATTRSPIAFFLVPFMLVWSGGSLGGIYGSQIVTGRFSLGISLFGLPFVAGSVLFWSVTLMAIAGKCEIAIDGDDAVAFTGLGPIGRRRRFRWSGVRSVVEAASGRRGQTAIQLEGEERVQLGETLSPERRYFLVRALRRHLRSAEAPARVPYR